MKRLWFWLGAAPVAAIAVLVFASSFGVAHEADDSGAVERQAVGLLGDTCSTVADPYYLNPSAAEIDAQAKAMGVTTSGWVGSRFIGSTQDMATSIGAKLAASGKSSAWLLTVDSGLRTIDEYRRVDLPSGRVAWQPGRTIQEAPCE